MNQRNRALATAFDPAPKDSDWRERLMARIQRVEDDAYDRFMTQNRDYIARTAKVYDIANRSKMKKDELARATAHAYALKIVR